MIMRSLKMVKTGVALLCSLFILGSLFCKDAFCIESNSLTGRDIAQKVHNRPEGNDRKGIMQMTLVNRRGIAQDFSFLYIIKDYNKDRKSLIVFQAPDAIKGTGFLEYEYEDPSREDDRWLYLPALNNVKRIESSSSNESFMGTDFTYDDMGWRSIEEDNHKLLREEEYAGHRCWIVEFIPKDKNYLYSKVVAWVRQDALIAAKAEYYDRQGNLFKRLTVDDMRKVNGFWTAIKTEMKNVQEKHKTILKLKAIQYNLGLKDTLFSISSLKDIKLRYELIQ